MEQTSPSSIEIHVREWTLQLAAIVAKAWQEQQTMAERIDMSDTQFPQRALLNKVGNVGAGVFVLLLFLGFCLFLCLIGLRCKRPSYMYVLSFLIYLIVFTVVVFSPRGTPPQRPPEGWDLTIIPMVIICVSMGIAAVLAFLGLWCCHWGHRYYARPISYHVDVVQTY